MRKIYLILIMCLFASVGHAQIGGPDTVCKGATVTFFDSSSADTYAWALDTFNTQQTNTTAYSLIDLKAYGAPYGTVMVYDNSSNTYYAFVVMRAGRLLRLDLGSNPYAILPLPGGNVTNLGTLGGALGDSSLGLDIVQDGGNWYGFITRNDRVIRVDFGSSITNNSPTTSTMRFASNLDYAYQITAKKYGTEWIAFVANRNGNNMTRLDFGTAITSTPSATNFGNNFQLQRPSQFSLYKENGSWYMIITNIGSGGGPGGNGGISRFEFGTNLKNNTPNGTLVGSLSGKLSQPRGINMFADCNQVYGLAHNGNSKVTFIDFKSTIALNSTSITGTDLGNFSLGNSVNIQCSYPFWYGDRMSLIGSSIDDSVMYIYDNVYSLPNPSQSSYTTSNFVQTLNGGGTIRTTLHANQGSPRGPEAYCKSMFVINTLTVSIVQQHIDTLYAAGTYCDWYVWKLNGVVIPGATNRYYVPTATGVYTCTGGKAGCSAMSNYYFEYSAKGIASASYNKAVMVYPNPTNGIFTVEVTGALTGKNITIDCYNAIGTLVAQKQLDGNNAKATIDLSALPKGAYQLKLQAQGEASITKRVIVE